MNYFEEMIEEQRAKKAEEAARFEQAKVQQQEDLKELCNQLKEERIRVFKSGDRAVIPLPTGNAFSAGYLVVNSFLDSDLYTCFGLLSECEYEINRPNIAMNVDGAVQVVKVTLDKLAKLWFKKMPTAKVDWTWYIQLKKTAKRLEDHYELF